MGDMKKRASAAAAALLIALSSVPLTSAAEETAEENSGEIVSTFQVISREAEGNTDASGESDAQNTAEGKTEEAAGNTEQTAPVVEIRSQNVTKVDNTPADPVIETDTESKEEEKKTNVSVGNVTSLNVSDVTTEGYVIKWNKVSGADGYRVYIMSSGKPKLFKTTTKTGLKIKVKAGAKNTFRVCAYVKNGSDIVEGGYVQKQFTSKPKTVTNFTYRRTKRGGLVFSWDPVERCSKYQLFYSTTKDGQFELFKEVSKDKSGISTGLMPKGKKLYFKMRAVSTAKDQTSYGTCSKKVVATVFNTLSVDEVMDSYSNSKSVKVVNGQGYKISDSLKQNLVNQLTYLGGDVGYILYDIDSGAAVAYNADWYIMPASSVKAPFMMYGLKRMDEGYSNLDTMLTYTAAQKHGGSGVIQNAAFGTQYSIRTLYQYIADYSDNVAYYMLQDHFGIDGYNKYISGLGCKTSLKTGSDRWGVVCATDAAREWNDIWNYLRSGPQAAFARKIYSSTCGANIRAQLGNKYTVYEKSGWTDGDYGYHNETALVRANHPYIVVCLSNRPSSQRMMNVAQVSENIHNAMWDTFKL